MWLFGCCCKQHLVDGAQGCFLSCRSVSELINFTGHVRISVFQICDNVFQCVTALGPKNLDVLCDELSQHRLGYFSFLDKIYGNVHLLFVSVNSSLNKITRNQTLLNIITLEFNLVGCHYHLFQKFLVLRSVLSIYFRILFSVDLHLNFSVSFYVTRPWPAFGRRA